MTPADLDTLAPAAKKFGELLLKVRPEWLALSSVETSSSGEKLLELRVQSPPSSDLSDPLWLYADGEEIVAGFDATHRHFRPDLNVDETLNDALAFMDDVISEKLVAICWFDKAQIRWGGAYAPNCADRIPRGGLRVRIRSWAGSYDRDVNPIPFASKRYRDNKIVEQEQS